MSNLLVIDWDFFFPTVNFPDKDWELYDWSHMESIFLIGHIWVPRAQSFLMYDKPLPGLSGEEVDFWERFQIAEDTPCYISESNLFAADDEVAEDVESVWLFDAHHDSGYREDKTWDQIDQQGWTCENWMLKYWINGVKDLHVRYPAWKDWAMEMEPEPAVVVDRQDGFVDMPDDVVFDRVFVCRSGAWVPPWLDQDYIDFVNFGPFTEIMEVGENEHFSPDMPREWDLESAQRTAAWMKEQTEKQR